MSNKDMPTAPVWHIPDAAELSFANQLLTLHLESALADLSSICQDKKHEESSGNHLNMAFYTRYNILQSALSLQPLLF